MTPVSGEVGKLASATIEAFGGTDDTDVAPCESLAFPPPSEVSANQPPRRASELKHAAAMMPT